MQRLRMLPSHLNARNNVPVINICGAAQPSFLGGIALSLSLDLNSMKELTIPFHFLFCDDMHLLIVHGIPGLISYLSVQYMGEVSTCSCLS
jgi:hypothetical protein